MEIYITTIKSTSVLKMDEDFLFCHVDEQTAIDKTLSNRPGVSLDRITTRKVEFDPKEHLVAEWSCGDTKFYTFVIASEKWPEGIMSPQMGSILVEYLRPNKKTAFCEEWIRRSPSRESMFIMEWRSRQ